MGTEYQEVALFARGHGKFVYIPLNREIMYSIYQSEVKEKKVLFLD